VIVDVDERSLAAIGQWPWRRDLIARLVAAVRDQGASAVALDIIFAEADRHSEKGAPAGSDAVLADTLRGGRVVLGYAFTFDAATSPRIPCDLPPLNLAVLRGAEREEDTGDAPFFRASGAICNLPALTRAARASGFLNAAPDADGILRRVPLLIDLDGHVYPSLALTAVAMATGTTDAALRVSNVNAASLILGERRVPLDGKSNLLVRYRGEKQTFPFVSAASVLSGEIPPNTFRDKIVFVGTTALGTREVVATPLDTLFTGVEVQATVADNLLQRDFLRREELAKALESLGVLTLAIIVAAIVARTRLLWGGLAAGGGLVATWYGAVWLVSATGIFVSPLFPTIGVVSAFAAISLAKSAIERRRAETAGAATTTAQRFMVQTLLSLTEVRDAETGLHSRRTQQYAKRLAESLSTDPEYHECLTPERIELLSSLAPLHDIGKVGVPDRILNKPSALTADELLEMQKHPSLGRDVILKAEHQVGVGDDAILAMAKDIVYTHHERWDGTGYPEGLSGTAIPLEGRLMAVVDLYDAAVTRNVYRRPISHADAVDFIAAAKGTHFDPAVVNAFLRVAADFEKISEESKAS
jgi:adenylate cyclase